MNKGGTQANEPDVKKVDKNPKALHPRDDIDYLC